MARSGGRRRRMLVPLVSQLESRRLLTVSVDFLGQQNGTDVVGPSPNVGGDGVQDIDLHLSALADESIVSILVQMQGQPAFEWEYTTVGVPPPGWAIAEFFYPDTDPAPAAREGDLYINPIVDSALGPTNAPLGSSTGSPTTVQNGDVLELTVTYSPVSGGPSTDIGSTAVTGLAEPPLPAPAVAVPSPVVTNSGIQVSWPSASPYGQNNSYEQGWVGLTVTGLNGMVISTATLSDQVGMYWSNTDSGNHNPLAVQEAANDQTANIYFPPVRNETVCLPGVSSATDMVLRLTFTGNPTAQYVTQFAGGAWNADMLYSPLNTNTIDVTNAAQLIAALEVQPGATEYDTVELPDSPIVLTAPLEINHSVDIVGTGNAALEFQASWSTAVPGAIYLDPTKFGYASFATIEFSDFSIDFNTAFDNTWYDPENPGGTKYAVVYLTDTNASPVELDLTGMTITGPPALDPTPNPLPAAPYIYAARRPRILSWRSEEAVLRRISDRLPTAPSKEGTSSFRAGRGK